MKKSTLDALTCPLDGQPLKLDKSVIEDEQIISGTLSCGGGHSWDISGGLPRMIPGSGATDADQQTRDSFSSKWQRIPEFGHDAASREIYHTWYLERYGFGDVDGLRAFLADKGKILDAGTGLGRDAMLYGENTPGQVYAVDISTSINFAHEHVGHLPNVHLAQADLTQLPFPKDFFDFIACDQVIHHTPNTEASFYSLAKHLAPGGEIAIYVYKKKAPIREFSDDFLRERYTQASEEECYEFSRAMTHLGKALTDLDVDIEIKEDIPALEISAGTHNLQRFLYWHVFKCYWNAELDFETNVMTNFDWYHPQHAHRHTVEEVQQWCAEAGLEMVHLDVVESGISFRARRGN